MEEQTTWQGHTFTLFVFTGIVVLCSIFFILGMLVGRTQVQKVVGTGTVGTPKKVEAKALPKEDRQDFPCFDSLRTEDPCALQPAPEPRKKAKPNPAFGPPRLARAATANAM